jgi:hypothetical protein
LGGFGAGLAIGLPEDIVIGGEVRPNRGPHRVAQGCGVIHVVVVSRGNEPIVVGLADQVAVGVVSAGERIRPDTGGFVGKQAPVLGLAEAVGGAVAIAGCTFAVIDADWPSVDVIEALMAMNG